MDPGNRDSSDPSHQVTRRQSWSRVWDRVRRHASEHREHLLYLIIGGWNTIFGYAVWAVLQFSIGRFVPYLGVIVLAWPAAVVNAYLGYRTFVFRSHEPVWTELPRFSLIYVATLIANLVLLPLALTVLPFSIYVVQAIFLGLMVIVSYLSHRYVSFRRRTRGPGGDSRYNEESLTHDG